MENKKLTVVITGASSGIGRATALEFARKGYNLALTARRQDVLNTVAAECDRLGGKTFTYAVDVSEEHMVYEFAEKALDEFGSIDVWVNNAAVSMLGPYDETPMESIRRLLDINLMGYMYGARAALKHFKKQGHGTLINIASQAGMTGQPFAVAYSTSKAAVRGLSLSLENEYADDDNIHICAVLPSTIDTPLFQNAANYMGRKVKAMEPIVDPWTVARTIDRLTKCPQAEVLVGGMAVQGMLMKFFAPRIFSKIFNSQVKSEHFFDEQSDPYNGNLFEPREFASVDGGWLDGKKSSGMTASPTTPLWISLIAGGLVAAVLTSVVMRQIDQHS